MNEVCYVTIKQYLVGWITIYRGPNASEEEAFKERDVIVSNIKESVLNYVDVVMYETRGEFVTFHLNNGPVSVDVYVD